MGGSNDFHIKYFSATLNSTAQNSKMAELLTEAEIKSQNFQSRQNTRLTQDSKAVVRLTELMSNGTITGSEEPKKVWLSDPIFTTHKLANFRTCFNNMRNFFCESATEGNVVHFSS